jgi:hypothetical protein
MKKRYIFSSPFLAPIAMLFIIGELLFKQIYLHPVSNIQLGLLSIPVYGCSLAFILKTINEQIQNIAQKKDTLCRRMYN